MSHLSNQDNRIDFLDRIKNKESSPRSIKLERQELGILKSSKPWSDVGISLNSDVGVVSIFFQLKDGSARVVFCHDIRSTLSYNPEVGIVLPISSRSVKEIHIKGQNLEETFQYLSIHRVIWFRESDRSFDVAQDNEPIIESIEFIKQQTEDFE